MCGYIYSDSSLYRAGCPVQRDVSNLEVVLHIVLSSYIGLRTVPSLKGGVLHSHYLSLERFNCILYR